MREHSFYKVNHHRALKDISEALEQKLYSSKDISEHMEYSNKFRIMCVSLKSVFSEDDCGKLKKTKTQIIQDAPSKTHIMW